MNAHGPLHALRFLHILIIVCVLAGPYTCMSPCRAQEAGPESRDNQTLQVSFFSLKPGNSIAPATLRLHEGGTLDLAIADETLTGTRGQWSLQGSRFTASADFSVARRPGFRYRLLCEGYHVMGLYAGRARLQEYDRKNRLLQEPGFLFYADARRPQRTKKDTVP